MNLQDLIPIALLVVGVIGFVVWKKSTKPKPLAPVISPIPVPDSPREKLPTPTIATAHNPFIALKEAGVPLFEVLTVPRYGFADGLSETEWAQLALAGYDISRSKPSEGGGIDRTGGDLNNGIVRVNVIPNGDGAKLTYTFSLEKESFVNLDSFTHSGSLFRSASFVVSGAKSFSGTSGGAESAKPSELINQNLPAGSYVVEVTYFGVLGGERGVSAQCVVNPPASFDHPGYTHY